MGQTPRRAEHGDGRPGAESIPDPALNEPGTGDEFACTMRRRAGFLLHPAAVWRVGSKLVHPFNPELGIGIVREIDGRYLHVEFPVSGREVTLAASGAGLERLILPVGAQAVHIETSEPVEIAEVLEHRYRLTDGREVGDAEIWPAAHGDSPVDRLARLHLDSASSFANRVRGLDLMNLREAGGLGSFLGGRIELFPHQLHAALRAVESDPVRWLLADEVGLGKTVEACLILSALVRTGRVKQALVVAPSTLAIQWLGELYRKFHQVFVLLDRERIESVESDFGEGVNPFEVHPFAVVPLEMLASDAKLLAQASEAGLEAVVLDEAHRLARREWTEAVGPLVREARHALLLTATPLQADREGFFRLFSLLHPEAFASFADFDAALQKGDVSVPCTSAVRRVDVGGLPPRVPMPQEIGPADPDLRSDPRTRWLVEQVPKWVESNEKALVFVRDAEVAEALAAVLESETHVRITLFHEKLSAAKRDIQVASFRESNLPVLLCSEAGGEGRNFQFCDRMVHYDLPPDPVELEQRIGRLDRIGREAPVEIVYFRMAEATPDLAALYERLGLFERAAAGLDTALAPVRPAVEAARAEAKPLDLDALLKEVEARRMDADRDLTRAFYPDAYTPDQADALLARVPEDLEPLTRAYCVSAAEDLGFDVIEKSDRALFYVEFGAEAKIDSLAGVEGGSRFLGTFDRDEALEKEEADFFASGHPLVEGLLLELEDGNRGRASLLEIEGCPGAGLLLIYKDGPEWGAVVVGADGDLHPEWWSTLHKALPKARSGRAERWGIGDSWADGIRALAGLASGSGSLVAAAFFRPRD